MDHPIPEGFELTPCPGCGSDRWTLARTGRDWILNPDRTVQIVRCDKCGLHFTNPRPSAAHLGNYYSEEYAPYQKQRGEIRRKSQASTALRTWILASSFGSPRHKPTGFRRLAAAAVKILQPMKQFGSGVPYQGDGRLLDFGCGNGTFLRRMKAVGWTCTGIDFSQQAVDAVIADGIPALQGTLPHPDLQPEYFDVVTMRQALEHVPNPRDVLLAAKNILKPGGKLLINVPNYESWEIDYFGDAAQTLQIPRHLLHFTPRTLRNLLESCGFISVELHQISRANWLIKSVQQLNRREKKKWDAWLKFRPAINFAAFQAQRRGKGNELIAIARKRR
ncbi:MAG: class I SAM-dependent methyltransferase [Tepidisphaeraceae bacterium]|jgi:SAM-dependent methyltransferase